MSRPDRIQPSDCRPIYISAIHFDDELKTGKMSVLELPPLASKYGLQGVEYRDVYWKDKAAELPAAADQLWERRLRAAYTTVTPLCHADPAVRKRLRQDIEDARALGASLLRVNLGGRPEGGAAGSAILAGAREAITGATRLGVRLTLENNSRAPGHQLADIRWALETFDFRFLGTNMDFANYATTGQDPLEAIRALAGRINYVHAKDARKTADGWQTTYLGNGSLPLKEIISTLDATGIPVPFCFEFPGEGDPERGIGKSLEFLATL
jgi:sugar phosphate isomerase/epimerase